MKSIIVAVSSLIATVAMPSTARADAKISGSTVFEKNCAMCHLEGSAYPGTLRLKEDGDPVPALRAKTDLDRDTIETVIRQGFGSMPSFKPTALSDAEIDAVADYLVKK